MSQLLPLASAHSCSYHWSKKLIGVIRILCFEEAKMEEIWEKKTKRRKAQESPIGFISCKAFQSRDLISLVTVFVGSVHFEQYPEAKTQYPVKLARLNNASMARIFTANHVLPHQDLS